MIALAACVVVLGWPTPALAQASTAMTPTVSLAAGGGLSLPFHADFDFIAGLWEVSGRVPLGRRAAMEISFGEWRHTDASFGHRVTRTARSADLNLLAIGRGRPLAVYAGGGIGMLTMTRSGATQVSSASFTVQGLGGLGVRLTSRLAAYGQAKLVVPTRDPGGSELRLSFGIRLSLLR